MSNFNDGYIRNMVDSYIDKITKDKKYLDNYKSNNLSNNTSEEKFLFKNNNFPMLTANTHTNDIIKSPLLSVADNIDNKSFQNGHNNYLQIDDIKPLQNILFNNLNDEKNDFDINNDINIYKGHNKDNITLFPPMSPGSRYSFDVNDLFKQNTIDNISCPDNNMDIEISENDEAKSKK